MDLSPPNAPPMSLSSHASTTPPPSNSGSSADHKRPRACESCRSLKVRCEPHDPQFPKGTCRRCAKAKRQCIFTVPTRKRQKKADSKVAELERKIDALTASLKAKESQVAIGSLTPGSERDEQCPCDTAQFSDLDSDMQVESHIRALMGPAEGRRMHERPPVKEYTDVIDRQMLSVELAKKLLFHYNENMVEKFPAVVFGPEDTVEDMRRRKPMLLLSVLAVASVVSHPDLHRALHTELTRQLAEKVFIAGEKSMELCQALMLTSIWYYPPDTFEELKFYTLIHQGAIMALDIGLGKRIPADHNGRMSTATAGLDSARPVFRDSISEAFNSLSTKDHHDEQHLPVATEPLRKERPEILKPLMLPDPCSIDSRRTLLACYWTCSHVALALRRPNLIRFTKFMDESLELLENSSQATDHERTLCRWVRLQRIAEEMSDSFAFDDPSATNISIHSPQIQHAMKAFALRIEDWKRRTPPQLFNPSVKLSYYATLIYTHEVALHTNHNVDDFRMPFTPRIVTSPIVPPNVLPTQTHIAAISACTEAARDYLNVIITEMPISDLLLLPVFAFHRVAYACMILIKIYFTAAERGSELGRIIEPDSLRVKWYIDNTLVKLAQTAEGQRSRPAGKFTMVVIMLRKWFLQRCKDIEGEDEDLEWEVQGNTDGMGDLWMGGQEFWMADNHWGWVDMGAGAGMGVGVGMGVGMVQGQDIPTAGESGWYR